MDSHSIGLIIVLIILVALSACFSSTETAFTSVNGIRLKNMAKEGDARAASAYKVYKEGTAAITTILIGNNIVNILATAIATSLFSEMFGEAGVAIATAVMTVLILLFGEITPKIVAKSKPESVAMLMARPMRFLIWLFKPINSIVVGAQSKWEEGSDDDKVTATENELLEIVSTIEQEGVLEQEERELIGNVIEFDDTSVHDVMVPRDDVIWLYDNTPHEEVIELLKTHKLSRFPVISHKTLKVVGILRIRDIFEAMLNNQKFKITEIMDEPIFVSQRKKLPQALEELQKSRVHMAIATESAKIDNFVGVVTLEDMIEEIVGEIYDEYDPLPDHVVEIGLHTYDVDGQVNLTHFFDEYLEDQELPKTKAKTIERWVYELSGDKNVRKGKELVYENIEIKVLETFQGMAKQVELTVYTASEEEE